MRKFISLLLLGCSGQVDPNGTLADGLGPIHFIGDDAPSGSANVRPNLQDYGGPKLHDLNLVAIAWGYKVNFVDGLDLPKFYSSLAGGPYLDVLSEYLPDAAQVKRHFLGMFFDGKPPSEEYATDLMITIELNRLIDSGIVPPNQGDTLYVVHLPPSMKAVDPLGGFSCVDFCGYHYTKPRPEGALRYAVIADLLTPGCDRGCRAYLDDGSLSKEGYDSTTIVTSHEVAEAVTDPNVGLYVAGDQTQLGWYDENHGEVGDICLRSSGWIDGFNVQKEWSNASSECRLKPAQIFDLTVEPQLAHLASSGSVTVELKTRQSVPTPATINLRLGGWQRGSDPMQPSLSGVTAQLTQSQIQAGGSTTLTFTSGPVDQLEVDTLWLVAENRFDVSQRLTVPVTVSREPRPKASPIPLYTGDAQAPHRCPSGARFGTNTEDGMYCTYDDLPLPGAAVNPYCDLQSGYLGYSWSDSGPDAPCDPIATRGNDGAGNTFCSYATGAIPRGATPYCLYVASGYVGYLWSLCPPGSRASNSNGFEYCVFDQIAVPAGAQPYCDHLQEGYFGFSYPLETQPQYQCPTGFATTSNGADLGFCLVIDVPVPAELPVISYCQYLVSNATLGFYWQVP